MLLLSQQNETDEVWGAGFNANYELGQGQMAEHQEHVCQPVQICMQQGKTLKMQIKKVIAGNFSAAINYQNQILIWGKGKFGVIKSPQKLFMDKVEFIDCKISKFDGDDSHAVSLDQNGKVYSWGNNQHGQLGHGDTRDRKLPS